MKKRNLYSVIILLVLISGIIFIGSAVNKNRAWEPAGNIKARIGATDKSLTDVNSFINDALSPISVSTASPFQDMMRAKFGFQ